MRLKTTLEQWLTLSEVERAGSIQGAAKALNKSHTTLIYAIKKLEQQLGVTLLKVEGRRAVLTEDGQSLLRRAGSMLEQARELEEMGTQIAKGVESEIVIAVDHLCNLDWIYQPMAAFLATNSTTSIQVVETSLSKTTHMVTNEQADIAIITLPITNYPAEAFGHVSMVPVVAASHPLAECQLGLTAQSEPIEQTELQAIGLHDLATVPQIVIRDLGDTSLFDDAEKSNVQNVGWLKSRQRITVDHFSHAFAAVENGVGYCRLPTHMLAKQSNENLVALEIEQASCYQVPLHITLPKGGKTGVAAQAFYEQLLVSRGEVRGEN
ncbi:LysR family transcriptional regulator [Photobacterium jeanii]|uniref:LysR family transcriptional regulator n=1 Tax=Photobacterium jeanii TaxID=858640 RepID=A0A178K7E6_9GAMM|nr:LysR family transcriptional regulator [Photobacterium jeanii]OAN13268.1 LysR family transcriptional regulator [Photobacterium jeanii]PST90265.1 LysR family transcriptional regulator [Photobacterium jeanii]